MALPYITVEKINTPPGTIPNVQTLQMSKGRIKVSDNLRPGTAQLTGRKPEDLPTLEIGDDIRITITDPDTSSSEDYEYRVADLTIEYGTIPSLDTWTLDLEDAFAYLGRAAVTRTWASGSLVSAVAANITGDVGIALQVDKPSLSTVSAQVISNGAALDVFQVLVNTEQALVQAGSKNINWFSRGWQSAITYTTFADNGTHATYDAITFGSMADNYSTNVIVYPRGSSEVVTGSGIWNYNLDSYSFDTAQAQYLGLYVAGVLSVQNSTPQTLSTLLNRATNGAPLAALEVGRGLAIIFRGTTYYALVEGFTVTSDPSNTRITYNLSSTEFYSFLTLNDAVLGRLDYNKLGF